MALIVTVDGVFALLCIRCVQPSGDKLLICTIAQTKIAQHQQVLYRGAHGSYRGVERPICTCPLPLYGVGGPIIWGWWPRCWWEAEKLRGENLIRSWQLLTGETEVLTRVGQHCSAVAVRNNRTSEETKLLTKVLKKKSQERDGEDSDPTRLEF